MLEQRPAEAIRARPNPNCYLCNSPGNLLYESLSDRLFGAPGKWTLKRCPNSKCALLWLDPMPLEEDIAVAYQRYYTHGQRPTRPMRPVRWALDGYRKGVAPLSSLFNPVYRERGTLELMCLGQERPGRVLDVGCGTGARLAKLRDLGWTVFGQEVDPQAVSLARAMFQLDVRLGPLQEICFPESYFDFVILGHVIEHLHDPIKLLVHCRRLLRKGGRLILTTPNSISFGHKWFGPDWRGLEPPRHLFIFSPATLAFIAEKSGLMVRRSWTTSAHAYIFSDDSLRMTCKGCPYSLSFRVFRTVYRTIYQYCTSLGGVLQPSCGEECVIDLEY